VPELREYSGQDYRPEQAESKLILNLAKQGEKAGGQPAFFCLCLRRICMFFYRFTVFSLFALTITINPV
jgi:hypothetical protein